MPYTRIAEIGRGGFGVVDRVADAAGNQYARKTLNVSAQPGIDPAALRARFDREVKYQTQINHPNVVSIVDSDLLSDPPWFTMPLAVGSLADDISVDRTLGGDPKVAIFDILAGLQEIHDKGYKHRDLKPANVLKYVEGGQTRYAISDFGLMAPETGMTSTLTGSNVGGGTPLYRAPECVLHFKRATNQSDIYSVGAILHDIFGGGAQRIPHLELSVPGEMGPIVERCTKQNPRRRYTDVAQLREAVFEVLGSANLTFTSAEEEEVVNLLQTGNSLTDAEWDRVFSLIDDNIAHDRGNNNVFRYITAEHIEHLAKTSPELIASLGNDYADYAQNGAFDFEYCDVIAMRAQTLFLNGELELKARLALALLVLGTSHNRWFVERRFVAMVGPDADDALVERIKVEGTVQRLDFKQLLSRVKASIGISDSAFHPALL